MHLGRMHSGLFDITGSVFCIPDSFLKRFEIPATSSHELCQILHPGVVGEWAGWIYEAACSSMTATKIQGPFSEA